MKPALDLKTSLGPYLVVAVTLAIGVLLAVITIDVPSIVVSVLLACGIAALLYGILGGVEKAGFDLGPLKVGGSAAVLLGASWLLDSRLDDQLQKIRDDRNKQRYSFRLDEHLEPPSGWSAVNEAGWPIQLTFTDPVTGEPSYLAPSVRGNIPLTLAARTETKQLFDVRPPADPGDSGEEAPSLGYIPVGDIEAAVGGFGSLRPKKLYGPQSLYLPKVRGASLPKNKPSEWGSRTCLGTKMPILVQVTKFQDSHADFKVTPCNGGESEAKRSSLKSDEAELFELEIRAGDDAEERTFIIAVLEADHGVDPPWSSFVTIEMESP